MFDRSASDDPSSFLTVLARAEPARIKAMAEGLLPALGAVLVLTSRTGLVMLPLRDTVKGTDFFLGEVLVAEARVTAATDKGTAEGYGMVTGRDLEQAMAMAVLDAARSLGVPGVDAFVRDEAALQAASDDDRLRRVEATRVDMETF